MGQSRFCVEPCIRELQQVEPRILYQINETLLLFIVTTEINLNEKQFQKNHKN